jgi:hypothetical protein
VNKTLQKFETILHECNPGSAPLRFSLQCKNTGVISKYDFSRLSLDFPNVIDAFICAIIGRRDAVGHLTRVSFKVGVSWFARYLGTLQNSPAEIRLTSELTSGTFRRYATWLKAREDISYGARHGYFISIQTLVDWIRRNYPGAQTDLHIEDRVFPHLRRMHPGRKPYSSEEWQAILRAVTINLENHRKRYETPYTPTWLGLPAPIDDVAPFIESRDMRHQHSMWDSLDYCVWYWENLTQAKCIRTKALRNMNGGRPLVTAVSAFDRLEKWGAPDPSSKSPLERFYKLIRADSDYFPRYIGEPCPIRYRNRYDKPEYLHWYWDNYLQHRFHTDAELHTRGHLGFTRGMNRVYGTIHKFHEAIGTVRTIYIKDLFPYFLLFAIRTALNPSTIARLTIDCIVRTPSIGKTHKDDSDLWQIDWTKIRSFSEGRTIPTHVNHDDMPVNILRRVLQITTPFRKGRKLIWLSPLTDTLESLNIGRRQFVKEHNLMADDSGDGQPRKPLSLAISRIRATIAMKEYVRTENMAYIQTLLGHKSASTTVLYLDVMENPKLMYRRGLHQDAIFIDLAQNSKAAVTFLKKHGIEHKLAAQILRHDNDHEAILSRCRAPLNSPQPMQKQGRVCTSNACLSCQNLIVTPYDIYRFFCFMNYHNHLLRTGELSPDQFDLTAGEVFYTFTEQIFPKFAPATVTQERARAISNPLPEWQISMTVKQ